MAKDSARDLVYKGLELIPKPLSAFVEIRLANALSGHWQEKVKERYRNLRVESGKINWDNAALFQSMNMFWDDAFREVLGRTERSIVNELIEVRNRHAHDEVFTYPEAARALDSMHILMNSISAKDEADKLDNMRAVILKRRFDEQQRVEERRASTNGTELNLNMPAGLKPWRDVVQPHDDVATGNFTQAQFAADLSKVHKGDVASEYGDPKEFYARTFLTQGLGDLLKGAAKRLSGEGGDPVIELQTNFGGGKTHSMLALYHMVSGISIRDLPELDQLLPKLEFKKPVKRAVLVGTARGPSDSFEPEKGLKIYTTWGEMAYQLGGIEGYEMVRKQDEDKTSPGSELLSKLFKAHAPCLILIDEWVAYLRQIYDNNSLPSGTFDNNISFVQALTEAVKVVPNALLVASLPASQIERGGEGGEQALERLKHTFSRVHASWLPASAEESYEIVRRRLFDEVEGENIKHKGNAIKQFMRMYEKDRDAFPQGSGDGDYKNRMKISYPIHPELFDQFYNSWSSIDRFQRTRGILRLMAQVVHELWRSNDSSVMIMPGGIPIGAQEVIPELTKNLTNQNGWPAIIASDVDGAQSLPLSIDTSVPTLGQITATRRVARALFMATAPLDHSQNPGIDQKRINRAVAQPGDTIVRFSDALHRLAGRATYLHSDDDSYWYATAPSLNRMASDKAAELDANLVEEKIDNALRDFVNSDASRNEFDGVHITPASSADIPDELTGCRVVVLGVKYLHSSGNKKSDAMGEARSIIAQRGTAPRSFKNVLVFLAGDKTSRGNLEDAARRFLAWEQIHKDSTAHNLRPDEANTAQRNAANAKQIFETRLKEAWKWLIYPFQEAADKDIDYTASSVSSQDRLFEKIKRNLVRDEIVFEKLGPQRLQRELDKYIWRDNHHLKTADIRDYCGKFIYMPRLLRLSVLEKTVLSAISQTVPGAFAYAEAYDETAGEYKGLIVEGGVNAFVAIDQDSVIIKPDVAEKHRPTPKTDEVGGEAKPSSIGDQTTTSTGNTENETPDPEAPKRPTRFRGVVEISSERPARDMQKIVEAIVEQLTTLPDCEVNLKLEIDATSTEGFDSAKTRTLLENANTLGFLDKKIE